LSKERPQAAQTPPLTDGVSPLGISPSLTQDPAPAEWLAVESLDLEAQGVAHNAAGKVVFIEGALPGERVQATISRRKNQWEQGTMVALQRESTLRVRPACPHFGLHFGACGGCKMQHLEPAAQVAVKQRALEDGLWHLSRVRPALILRPIQGPAWGYRHRARLSVRWVHKRQAVLVGFHERKSRYVADMQSCAVLPPAVSALLLPLRALIGAMDARETLPQIELAIGDEPGVEPGVEPGTDGDALRIAFALRHLKPLSPADLDRLREFGVRHRVQWWLQPKGPDTVQPLDPGAELAYRLPAFGIEMPFRPTDFTQVNAAINRVLVGRAISLLAPQPHESVIDWFCGIGNFTLPLATRCAQVLGVEGSSALVERARANARHNRLDGRARFEARDLFQIDAPALKAMPRADVWLIDPPREGALALVRALAEISAEQGAATPRRIVYVSCNPATLARDAGLLVHQAGYRCEAAGVVNMFPHTAHVESIAVFDRGDPAMKTGPEGPAA
jgi:23S rRNA (uracil1939-C5)-methyltransferase